MPQLTVRDAIASIPAGAWAVGVSGGADSVAFLLAARPRSDLRVVVAHLNHQARGRDSDDDEAFVRQLSHRLGVPCEVSRRSEIEPTAHSLPANPSARFRKLRQALFTDVVRRHALGGVLLAHHADDQAETVLLRLLRGSGPMGLCGMSPAARIGELTVLRPLLSVNRDDLRVYLEELGQDWRDDASNASLRQQRNRVRAVLAGRPVLRDALLSLRETCAGLREWARGAAPALGSEFAMGRLADLPDLVARESAARWLERQGVAREAIEPAVLDRVLLMSRDAASPARVQVPGGFTIIRRGGRISARSVA
ncbi:MAG: tRNA lysidine(34) synthetase TilS [Tepidisphaeraceae bacterium]